MIKHKFTEKSDCPAVALLLLLLLLRNLKNITNVNYYNYHTRGKMMDGIKGTYSYLRARVATQCKHLKISFPWQFSTSPNKVREYTFDKISSPAHCPLRTFLFFAIGDEEEGKE